MVNSSGSAAAPAVPCPKNSIVPLITSSVGLTSTKRVVQPPPSASCGNISRSPTTGDSPDIGNVVMRNSLRSFVWPRSATTETGEDEKNVNVPAPNDPLLNGASSKKFPVKLFGGIEIWFCPKTRPLASTKKKET